KDVKLNFYFNQSLLQNTTTYKNYCLAFIYFISINLHPNKEAFKKLAIKHIDEIVKELFTPKTNSEYKITEILPTWFVSSLIYNQLGKGREFSQKCHQELVKSPYFSDFLNFTKKQKMEETTQEQKIGETAKFIENLYFNPETFIGE